MNVVTLPTVIAYVVRADLADSWAKMSDTNEASWEAQRLTDGVSRFGMAGGTPVATVAEMIVRA